MMTSDNSSTKDSSTFSSPVIAKFILIFVAYFFTAKGGLSLDAVSGFATLVWPPTGIALAALLVFGYRFWPAIALAAFSINFLTGATAFVALGIALGNTLEAVIGAFFLHRFQCDLALERIRDVLLFIFFGALLNTVVSATIGVSSLWLGGVVPVEHLLDTWLAWWIGDVLGALIIGNLLLNIRKLPTWGNNLREKGLEFFILVITLYFFSAIIFLNLFGFYNAQSTVAVLVYLISPFLVWAALRFGTVGAAFSIFTVSAVAILGTVLGRGPFMESTLSHNLLLLQVFMGSIAVTTMILAAENAERTRATMQLRGVNRKLHEQTDALSEAQRIAQMGSWQWEKEGNVTTCSTELYHLLEFTPEACQSVTPGILALVAPEDRRALERAIDDALCAKTPFEFDHEVVSANGTVRWMRERGNITANEEGDPIRISGTTQDVTNEKELDRAKTEFISLTSHQLRTPPTGIKWYTTMLLDEEVGPLTAAQRKYLEEIADNTQRMIDVVNSVLNISQIELGVFQNQPASTDIANLINNICEEFEMQIKNNHITLAQEYPQEAFVVVIDPTLVRIVVQNLLFNAIKYTKRGGTITIGAAINEGTLTLKVTDTGRGIPAEDMPNIFKKFFRARNAGDRGAHGTGLGLYIVKRILEQIKGRISFTSELGKGTAFSVSIPLQPRDVGK